MDQRFICCPARRGAWIGSTYARTSGFTLIEVMMATAVSLILVGMLVTAFGFMGDRIAATRNVISDALQMRGALARLQADLDGATAIMRPPLRPEDDLGYFEIIEGPKGPVVIENVSMDDDDVLMFTARSLGAPFVGKYQTSGGDASYVESQVAEIAWFVKDQKLYRRVMLVLPELGTLSGGASFAAESDVSARLESTSAIANTLGDLTKRENRLSHSAAAFPYALVATLALDASTDGTRGSEDVVLDNVTGFDVKVWDAGAPVVFLAEAPPSQGLTSPLQFDFGSGAPQAGWTPVNKSSTNSSNGHYVKHNEGGSEAGYYALNDKTRSATVTPDSMKNMLLDNLDASNWSFFVNIPNGTYLTKIYLGDAQYGRSDVVVFIEGKKIGTYSTTGNGVTGEIMTISQRATVSDGQIEFQFYSQKPEPYPPVREAAVCGIEILNEWEGFNVTPGTELTEIYTRKYDFGTDTSPVEAGYLRFSASGATDSTGQGNGKFTSGSPQLKARTNSDGTPLGSSLYHDQVALSNTAGNSCTLEVDVPENGSYDVALSFGDTGPHAHEGDLSLQDQAWGTFSTGAAQVRTEVKTATVSNGKIKIKSTVRNSNHLPLLALAITFKPSAPDPNQTPPASIPPSVRPPQGVSLMPGDPGYIKGLQDALNGQNRAKISSYGAFVDLNYMARMGAMTSDPNAPNYTPISPNLPEPDFAGPGNVFSGLQGTKPFTASSPQLPSGVTAAPSVYDTWSEHYEYDGVSQNAGDTVGAVGKPVTLSGLGTTPDAPPPYSVGIRGLQIRIQVMNPRSQDVRQVTLVHDFLPE